VGGAAARCKNSYDRAVEKRGVGSSPNCDPGVKALMEIWGQRSPKAGTFAALLPQLKPLVAIARLKVMIIAGMCPRS